jgi:hypothetical protein
VKNNHLWRWRNLMTRAKNCHRASLQVLIAAKPDVEKLIHNQRRAAELYLQARAIRESWF